MPTSFGIVNRLKVDNKLEKSMTRKPPELSMLRGFMTAY